MDDPLGNLANIDHFVVLMLENHSFDNLLGWLYSPGNPPPYDKSPAGQPTFCGLGSGDYSNPVSAGSDKKQSVYRVHTAFDPRDKSRSLPDPDPGEGYIHTNVQLFQSKTPPGDGVACNQGFIIDYATAIPADNRDDPLHPVQTDPTSIMGCYDPAVPIVLTTLAREFAVCDQWYCSVPTQTWPNRRFFHSATSWGDVLNTPTDLFPHKHWPTLFDQLSKNGNSWYNYHHGVPLTGLLFPHLLIEHPLSFPGIDDFVRHARKGELPDYSFIEPSFVIEPSDQLPPHPLWKGEKLIARVYDAIFGGSAWDKTLLIVTYDEHGGCFDHVPPPPKATPPDDHRGKYDFGFDRFGVRVPTVLCSAYTQKGTIFRSSGDVHIDHTSVMKTVRKRFGITDNLTRRDAKAPYIDSVLNLGAKREKASLPSNLKPSYSGDSNLDDEPLSSFQRDILKLAAAFPRADAAAGRRDASQVKTRRQLTEFIDSILDEVGARVIAH